ncbi:MAG: diheme cytochrome c [Proteobacteria bacterium]|nr:diheme cytochrome c [Pseudomonadota bacterium]
MFHAGWNSCLADDDCHHGDDYRYPGNKNQHYLAPVTNPVYKETCGACHFAYQPELLPAASWQTILNNSADHFGESLEIDDDSRKGIAEYLQANSADKSGAKRAVKIIRSLGSSVPQRITDIPYIREKHHEISAKVFERPAIGSLSNCSACHKTAEQGIYL